MFVREDHPAGEALALFLRRWDQAGYIDVLADLMSEHGIVSVVTQIVTRTLSAQSAADSSWDVSTEVTAYALLTLKKLGSLPGPEGLGTRINAAINAVIQFLREHESDWDRPSHIWIEKVSYGSGALSLTYCLAALAAPRTYSWGQRVRGLFDAPAMDSDDRKGMRAIEKAEVSVSQVVSA